ncbi:MAG: hypothetical protein LEGION0398_MBIBDBAK_00908 [Legionellaceae bacterium]
MLEMTFIQQLTIWALPILFAITFHEVAHGWVALRCGDKTALMLGRLSINPLNHIDIVGTIIVPGILLMLGGFLFGWAKPVPVNWNNLRKPRRDMMLVALAGPVANLIMVFFWACLAKLGIYLQISPSAKEALFMMGLAGININLLLLFFNLIPLPPLDGSKVILSLLPTKLAWHYSRLENYGLVILFLLLFIGGLNYFLIPIIKYFSHLILVLFNLK